MIGWSADKGSTTIRCDIPRCTHWIIEDTSIKAQARRRMKSAGWVYTHAKPFTRKVDLCPTHAHEATT